MAKYITSAGGGVDLSDARVLATGAVVAVLRDVASSIRRYHSLENTRGLTMPNGGRRLKFFLTDKEQISVRINAPPRP